jgi:glycosyltransferase involved in cell wall biosynthesis
MDTANRATQYAQNVEYLAAAPDPDRPYTVVGIITPSGTFKTEAEAIDYLRLLRLEVDRQGLGDHVHLLGSRHDVSRLLSAMDVVALPSHTEAFGRTIIEAMARSRSTSASYSFMRRYCGCQNQRGW